jgi:hypothetical protein
MARKITCVITLVAFFFFSVCCASHYVKQQDIKKTSDSKKQKLRLAGVQTTSGEYFRFSENEPAGIIRDFIMGIADVEREVEINQSDISRLQENRNDKITKITTKDGKTYEILSYRKTEDKIIATKLREQVSIPLSQAELVWVYKTNPGNIVLIAGISILVVAAAVTLIIGSSFSSGWGSSTTQCCPFVYSFDGEKYMFDAEPYGGAICQGLERTDWCPLENLKETDGQYKILVVNELDEIQHTNEVALLVVDHPKNTAVAPGSSGKIHTIARPTVPDKAFDAKGNDILPFVVKNDRVFWTSRIEGRDLEKKKDLRDELIFEFPKPRDVKKAKLLVNACTTHWGSHVIKRYLDLYGDTVYEWYDSIKTRGPEYYRFVNMHVKDELYALNIRVQTEKGWIPMGFMRGGGPLISENKVYPLNISNVPGDVLRIKLTPPVNFWMINHLAVDYSDDLDVCVNEVKPVKAIDNNGRNIFDAIDSDDSTYHVMPYTGDQAELVFEAPPRTEGMQRSLILKVKGYYDIHLEAKGKPQLALIEKLQKEPGFVVQHAFREYLKWKDEVMAAYLSQCKQR